ncbi:MAG: dUTP diphosphatase, partial [Clostridia bacterium]|nr:dUTP diphosphatase [Clostridia bacterium]
MVRDPGTSVTEPRYATSGSAGMDLAACLDKPVTLAPGEIVKIGTGIAIQLPDQNYAAMVFPR